MEGGAATLIVAPSGESLLVDTGFPGNDDRDAKRIQAAAMAAGLTRIDNLVITHFHVDHVGGVAALSKLMPIGKIYDHGESIESIATEGRDAVEGLSRHGGEQAYGGQARRQDPVGGR